MYTRKDVAEYLKTDTEEMLFLVPYFFHVLITCTIRKPYTKTMIHNFHIAYQDQLMMQLQVPPTIARTGNI